MTVEDREHPFQLRIESAFDDSVTVRLKSKDSYEAWLRVLRKWEGKFYFNGVLEKRAEVMKRRWKRRFFLLSGPDVRWAKDEGMKWLGQVCAHPFIVGSHHVIDW